MRTDASADTNSEPSNKFAQVLNIEEYRMSDMPDCEVYYMPSFIQENVSREWYKELLDLDSCMYSSLKDRTHSYAHTNVIRVSAQIEGVRSRGYPVKENSRSVLSFPCMV